MTAIGSGGVRQWLPTAALVVLWIAGFAMAFTLNSYYVFVLANVALLALVGIGLNVLIGLIGQISFGHVGFYAIGAYTVAILTTQFGVSFWIAWPLAALLAAAMGALLALPALRVKGPYLAMITIAFGFIVEHAIIEMRALTGGQNGLMGIAGPTFGSMRNERVIAIVALAAAGAALWAFARLSRGTWGAALRAVRDAEVAAESIGLDPIVIKTVAFALSAACAGAAGALFAPLSGMVTPQAFGFAQSILFVLVVIIGGAGSVIGPVIGALIVGVLPEVLSSLEEYRLLFFGGLLLVVLWVAPSGAVGALRATGRLLRRAREPVTGDAAIKHEESSTATFAARPRAPLILDALDMQFGGVRAVDRLSFEARPGEVLSLIGPNGAGKTTALNLLSGFYRPTHGDFRLGAASLSGQSAMRISRAGIARTYQTSQLFGSLGVLDNVRLAMCRGRVGSLFARTRSDGFTSAAKALLIYCGVRTNFDAPAAGLAHVDR